MAQNDKSPEAPSERSQQQSWRRYIVVSILQLAALLMMYVLSIGPMFWHWHHAFYFNGSVWIVLFYMPLLYACEIEPIGRLINWYINLWIL